MWDGRPTRKSAMDISVIIVTYNSADQIAGCLESVLAQADVAFEVIVVDNASSDDTRKILETFDRIRVVTSSENLGFGRGCNLGFTHSSGRQLYLLNPDTRLAGKTALADLCRRMDDHPHWGMAGTRVRSADGKSESQPAHSYPAQRHVHRDFSKLPGKIAWIIGASMIIRREQYEKLGGFDPGFFLYSEETDCCLRLRELGFEIGHVPEVLVEHIGGASEGTRDPRDVSARKLEGLLRFRQKHYPPDDCVFLAKRDMRRAWFRMIGNGLLASVQPKNSKAWQKSRAYRGIWEVSRKFIIQKRINP